MHGQPTLCRLRIRLLALFALLFGAALGANAQAFTNGDFEVPVLPSGTYQAVNPGDTWLTGWTIGGPGADIDLNNGAGVYSGSQFIVFNGGNSPPGGVLSQTFSTAVGEEAVLSLALQEGAGNGPDEVSLTAEILAGDGSTLASNTFVPPQNAWGVFQLIFTTTTATTTVVLTDTSPETDAVDLWLDDVQIGATNLQPPTIVSNPVSQSVPPGTAVNFSVTLGAAPATVQWYYSTPFSTNAVPGAVGTNLEVTALGSTVGNYWAVAQNLAGTATSTTAQLTLVDAGFTNGDFETPLVASSGEQLNPGDTWLTGWQVGGPGGDITVENAPGGFSGNQWINFNGYDSAPGGILAQTFSTSIGVGYLLTVELEQNGAVGEEQGDSTLMATVLASDGSQLASDTFSPPEGAWEIFSLYFTPTTSNTTIVLTDTSPMTDGVDLAMDDVMVGTNGLLAPTILVNPVTQSVAARSTVNFSIVTGGGPPSDIQWYYASALGTNLVAGAIGTELTVTASTASVGSYWATVANQAGTAVSAAAQLIETGAPFTNGDFETPVISSGGQLINPGDTWLTGWATFGSGGVELLSGANAYSGNQLIGFHVGSLTGGVLEQTCNVAEGPSNLLSFALFQDGGVAGGSSLTATVVADDGTILASNTFVPPIGQWRLFGEMFAATTPDTTIVLVDSSPSGGSLYLGLDDVALTQTNIAPPTILKNPQSQTAAAGATVTFTVGVSGTGYGVQWFHGTAFGTNAVLGGSSTNLTLTAGGDTAGYYWATATNILSSVSSGVAQLTVTNVSFSNGDFEDPALASGFYPLNPGDAWLSGWIVGGTGGIALSNSPLAYSGEQFIDFNGNGAPAGGILAQNFDAAVGREYAFGCALQQIGTFSFGHVSLTALVIAADGSVTASNTFVPPIGQWGFFGFLFHPTTVANTLVLKDTSSSPGLVDLGLDDVSLIETNLVAPTVMINPANQITTNGGAATFGVTFGGGPAYIQWYHGTPIGTNVIAGASGTNLTVVGSEQAAGIYWATATNLAGGVVSAAAQLSVLGLPFTNGDFETPTNPPNTVRVIHPGDTWLTGWMPGGASNTMQLKRAAGAYSSNQWLLFTGGNVHPKGVIAQTYSTPIGQSNIVSFALEEDAPVQISVSVRVIAGDGSVVFSNTFVPASGWHVSQFGFTATTLNTTIVFTDTSPGAFGTDFGLDDVLITPTNAGPSILTNPVSVSTVVGSSATFSVVALGSPTPDYHWEINGVPIPGAPDSPTLTISNLAPSDAGAYSVVVSNSSGFFSSSAAPLDLTYFTEDAQGKALQLSATNLIGVSHVQPGVMFTVGSINSVSAKGGTVQLANGVVTYNPPAAGFAGLDSFDYTLAPAFGQSLNGSVTILVVGPNSNGSTAVGFEIGGGKATIHFAGVPGTTYDIEVSTNLTAWSVVGSVEASEFGAFQFQDTNNIGLTESRFYRTAVTP